MANLASVTVPAQPTPSNPVHVVASGLPANAVVAANSRLYVLDFAGRTVRMFGLDGGSLGAFTVPWRLSAPALAVDSGGYVYLARYPFTLVKLASNGTEVWSRNAAGEIMSVYGMGSGAGTRIGVVQQGRTESTLFDAVGNQVGASGIADTAFSPTADGGVVATDTRYVRRYGPAGDQRVVFGDSRKENDPQPTGGPFHFYQQGGAALAPDGTYYVADALRGIHSVSAEGLYRGAVGDDTLGGLTERSWLAPIGDRLYFATGGRFHPNQKVAWVSFSDLAALVATPKAPHHVLGLGAGLATDVTGQYFPPGRTPTVTARFDGWWASLAPRLRLAYTVRERKQVVANETVAPTEVQLPTTPQGLAAIPLTLPAPRPGAYEIDARLIDTSGGVVGATCFHYTVGAPGHRLDFTALPPGTDHGGPAPPRGVALADQLGTGGLRAKADWAKLLPQGAGGPMDFSAYDASYAAAAQEARARGVAFWVQVGEGQPIERQLVREGSWERRLSELVAHFRGVVPAWEAWNEPNNSFGPPDAYVSQVLAPLARAVRGADPAAKVIGGSTIEVAVDYWQGIVAAGGLSSMDVAAVHLFTGHARSFEEHGNIAAIRALRDLLARSGAGSMPIWNTESAWWSNGPASFFSQADRSARGFLWMRGLGIERWNYHMIEGAYGDYALTYSLIQAAGQVDHVKPAALATMTAAGQTAGRPFTGLADTGIPHAYAAGFGPRAAGGDTLVAAWTDDMRVATTLVAGGASSPVSVTVTDLLGDATTMTLSPGQPVPLALSGAPVYLTAPPGTTLRLGAAGAFGANVAAAGAGASASASSAVPANPAVGAIDGVSDALERGDLPGLPAWASAPGDPSPTLTVRLSGPRQLDRILVTTHSLYSIIPGLRNYDVELQTREGTWVNVAQVRDQFHARRQLVTFPAREAVAIRLIVGAIDYGGLAGGLKPWFWPTDASSLVDAALPWYGPAVVEELEAYEATGAPPAPQPVAPAPSPPPPPPPPPPPSPLQPGGTGPDYDGDGKADFAVLRPSSGEWLVVQSSTNTVLTRQWGLPGDVPVPADYDGDRRLDFAVWRPSSGEWWVVQSSTNTTVTRQWGLTGDVPVPADYDGDGKADFAVWRPSSGTWWVVQSSTNTTPTRQWGEPNDVPVPADYDGDGRDDFAVWRPSTGHWWLIHSSGNQVSVKHWGDPGDVAVPADYNSDGRDDFAVWRPSSGTWWVVDSRTGEAVSRQWGLNGDVPVPRTLPGRRAV
ncbi:MAG: FG-GAP-like repeat-containing protein [Actinomycetota bacterium]|nr:FG-GAP-like repeat-containing protein [Actinomycetota bacterium]